MQGYENLAETYSSVARAGELIDSEMNSLNGIYENRLLRIVRNHPGSSVHNIGSSAGRRRTCIVDPKNAAIPFPPDMDYVVVLDNEEATRKVIEETMEWGGKKRFAHKEEKHKKTVVDIVDHAWNISIAFPTRENIQSGATDVVSYRSYQFNPDQQLEARVLKILLRRYGAYGAYNRALRGLDVEELIHQYQTTPQALEAMSKWMDAKKTDWLVQHVTKERLLKNISPLVCQRLTELINHVRSGEVRSNVYSETEWYEFHKNGENKVPQVHEILCAPASCGRRPNMIAAMVRNSLESVLDVLTINKNKSRGIDYLVIPYQGTCSISHKDAPKTLPKTVILSSFTADPPFNPVKIGSHLTKIIEIGANHSTG